VDSNDAAGCEDTLAKLKPGATKVSWSLRSLQAAKDELDALSVSKSDLDAIIAALDTLISVGTKVLNSAEVRRGSKKSCSPCEIVGGAAGEGVAAR
jgi:hypothetical protein